MVTLNKNGKSKTIGVHVLVAKHFLENENNLPEVNHKDFNRQNNHVDNLEWCTHEYNILYSMVSGHYEHVYKSGKDNPNYGNHKLSEFYKNNPDISKEKQGRQGSKNGRAKVVILYDKDMNQVATFSYIGECAKYMIKNGLSVGKESTISSNISRAIKENKLYLNHYYKTA